ncbi:hypothetical protein [Acidithrix ferrooxidans]|uniref:Uncharacterized protein n=1 Tax=Acidithrix ferrooxidans TaxID=1280514 RepID=A0A0D8HM03_9ACTN|nr:hypothetical protein [Acidithrix ferrooxidans]KJF18943.1 hypothetical protein AXFE_01470 [Acidithrix ferrooxidans]
MDLENFRGIDKRQEQDRSSTVRYLYKFFLLWDNRPNIPAVKEVDESLGVKSKGELSNFEVVIFLDRWSLHVFAIANSQLLFIVNGNLNPHEGRYDWC